MVLYTLCKLASWSPTSALAHRASSELDPTAPSDHDEERDAAHLASAADRHELEFRIRELDRPGRTRRGPFHHS